MRDVDRDKERSGTYFRLTPEQFKEVLSMIDVDIRKINTNHGEAITTTTSVRCSCASFERKQ